MCLSLLPNGQCLVAPMTKLRVQAQHLQPGDVVGSGEVCKGVVLASIKFPSSKVEVMLVSDKGFRNPIWGKYTMINVERAEK